MRTLPGSVLNALRRGGADAGPLGRRSAAGNFVALSAALAAVSVASLLVARLASAAVLGEYTLLRVLPWLLGVVISCGLPVTSCYFLGARPDDRQVRPALSALAGLGCVVSGIVWLALLPVLHQLLLSEVPMALLLAAGITVPTQLLTVWAKACCQGSADLRGANTVIVCEELLFLPAYGIALGAGLSGITAVVAGMVGCGVGATCVALHRLYATGFTRRWSRPSVRLARTMIAFGARGQLGNLLWLVNLRLDFLILGGIAGPATLGVYAVASKFAELMRLPATALNYVLYPRFTRQLPLDALRDARRLLKRACLVTIAITPILAGAAVVTIPAIFGAQFKSAVVPACILLIGLAVEGAAAVGSAYLWGTGRPGANSLAMGAGVVVTVVLDLLLIPAHRAIGASVASTIAYLTTTAVLTALTLGSAGHLRRKLVVTGPERTPA